MINENTHKNRIKICLYCKSTFTDKGSNNSQKYCSKKCWHIVRGMQILGINNPNYNRKHTEQERKVMSEKHYNCKGINNPNYGRHLSSENKQKISKANKGLKRTPEVIEKLRIAGTGRKGTKGFTGKHHSQENIKRWSNIKTGKRMSESTKQKLKIINTGKELSSETKQKIRVSLIQEKCYLWRGGTSKEQYPFEFNHELKESIRRRDEYQCQICYILQNGQRLSVHHIDYNKHNLNKNNLISLCHSCHSKTNNNREYYMQYFNIIMRNNYACL
jgi:hypothetical protein